MLEINATQTVGTVGNLNAYVRIYEPIADLIGAFQENGFDVWVLTASPQYFVDAISSEVGIAPSRVVGIRNVLVNGRVTASLEGCGTIADGARAATSSTESASLRTTRGSAPNSPKYCTRL